VKFPHAALAVALLFSARAAGACPLCHTENGRAVRAGIFTERFPVTLAEVLAPFPILVAAAAAVHRFARTRR
jgi:hypothetical protein